MIRVTQVKLLLSFVTACASVAANPLAAQSLRGSPASMGRQYQVAIRHNYSFLENANDIRRFVRLGLLVPVRGGTSYALGHVSFAYVRPAIRTFIERLASQYRAACGERLVVTSLTRPAVRQPANASDYSVHPTGMAVDLRVSRKPRCRAWLERTLLALEKANVIEATRERHPAHYHIAVFPRPYLAHVERLQRSERVANADGGER